MILFGKLALTVKRLVDVENDYFHISAFREWLSLSVEQKNRHEKSLFWFHTSGGYCKEVEVPWWIIIASHLQCHNRGEVSRRAGQAISRGAKLGGGPRGW